MNGGKDGELLGGEKRKQSFDDDHLKMIEEQVEKTVEERNKDLFKNIEATVATKVNSQVIEAKIQEIVRKILNESKLKPSKNFEEMIENKVKSEVKAFYDELDVKVKSAYEDHVKKVEDSKIYLQDNEKDKLLERITKLEQSDKR